MVVKLKAAAASTTSLSDNAALEIDHAAKSVKHNTFSCTSG